MARRRPWACLAFTSLIVSAQAGALDDFTNNLFSDLAPVLALFGERATMQFMSQSLGWADCIALAMAPLGIITIIVSAIRVGGPMRLKAIIGRAKENTSVAEMELMSSTSREVCELYNGESIVRCQGLAPVWEYICLVPRGDNANDPAKRNSKTIGRIHFKTLDQAIQDGLLKLEGARNSKRERQTQPSEKGLSTSVSVVEDEFNAGSTIVRRSMGRTRPWFRRGRGNASASMGSNIELGNISQHLVHGSSNGTTVGSTTETGVQSSKFTPANDPPNGAAMIVIRNTGPEAPNISLNLSESHSRTAIRTVAVMGIILQLGVLAFFAVMTYPSYIRDDFKKDDEAVPEHAFPLAASGTILDFLWNIDVIHNGLISTPISNPAMSLQLRLAHKGKSWKVLADDIDAVLSLWAYTARGADQEFELSQGAENFKHVNSENDSWLRNKIYPASLRILCPADNDMRDQICKDLSLWAPKAMQAMFNITDYRLPREDKDEIYDVPKKFQSSRIVGFNPQKRPFSDVPRGEREFWRTRDSVSELLPQRSERAHWAIETQETLDLLYAKDLLYSFFCSMAQTLRSPVRSRAEIENILIDITWRNVLRSNLRLCVLKHGDLNKLIETLIDLELGSEIEATLSLLLPLSFWDKAPVPFAIFDVLCEEKIKARKAQNWELLFLDHDDLNSVKLLKEVQLGRAFFLHLFFFLIEHAQDAQDELWLMNVEGRKLDQEAESNQPDGWSSDMTPGQRKNLDQHFRKHRTALLTCLRILGNDQLFEDLQTLYTHQDRHQGFLHYLREPRDIEHDVEQSETRLCHRFHARKCLPWRQRKDPPDLSAKLPQRFNMTSVHLEAMKINGNPATCRTDIPWINQPDASGSTPLHHAARTESLNMVEYLIKNGADVNSRDFRGYTPLHYACGYRDDNVIIPLTDAGATFDVQGTDGAFPLHVAAGEGNVAVLAHLNRISSSTYQQIIHGLEGIEWKAKDFHGRLAVHWAVVGGHWGAVEELYAFVNETDNYGWTALHLAILHGKDEIVRNICRLSKKKNHVSVDMEKTDTEGRTALHLARIKGNSGAADTLIEAGAAPDPQHYLPAMKPFQRHRHHDF
ncbi:Serine/threonine-protein phosphatase 6 regulatory ankyrin repeat subunit B [Colletotrichum tropicale]|nr:Serine/threonine-protein phosphatase 6 regulatory ankyrin repeat subunit B [Colletotrichum tropicale]